MSLQHYHERLLYKDPCETAICICNILPQGYTIPEGNGLKIWKIPYRHFETRKSEKLNGAREGLTFTGHKTVTRYHYSQVATMRWRWSTLAPVLNSDSVFPGQNLIRLECSL